MAYICMQFQDLIFWDQNPRIPSSYDKQEDIKKAIANLDSKKLLSLCKTIIQYKGIIEPPLIDDKNIVYDGNRRLTALALLNDSSFVPDDIKKQLEKITSKNKKLIEQISANVTCRQETDPKLIQLIVDERHATDNDGLKQVPWGPMEKLRRKDPQAFILQLIEFANNNGLILPAEGFSTFERIINTKEISKKFQLLWEAKEKDSKPLLKILKTIYSHIEKGDFDTRKLGKSAQIKDAVLPLFQQLSTEIPCNAEKSSSLSKTSTIAQDTTVPATVVAAPAGKSPAIPVASKTTKAGAQRSTERKFLILKTSCLPDTSHLNKINDVINELRRLKIQEFPIAVAILFRTLLELSTDHYLYFQGQKTEGILKQKLVRAINKIQQNRNYTADTKDLETLKTDIENQKEDVSITKLNTFVHAEMLPNINTLILQYINMEKLIAFMLSDTK